MSNIARLVPWRSWEEWLCIYQWLFSDDVSLKKKGIARVRAWASRGRLPGSIEATSNLLETMIGDNENNISAQSDSQLRLLYSIALARFVAAVLDASQTSQTAESLHSLAQKFQLPSTLVEIRHASVHGQLPNLSYLRDSTIQALVWLNRHYWIKQMDEFLNPRTEIFDFLTKLHKALAIKYGKKTIIKMKKGKKEKVLREETELEKKKRETLVAQFLSYNVKFMKTNILPALITGEYLVIGKVDLSLHSSSSSSTSSTSSRAEKILQKDEDKDENDQIGEDNNEEDTDKDVSDDENDNNNEVNDEESEETDDDFDEGILSQQQTKKKVKQKKLIPKQYPIWKKLFKHYSRKWVKFGSVLLTSLIRQLIGLSKIELAPLTVSQHQQIYSRIRQIQTWVLFLLSQPISSKKRESPPYNHDRILNVCLSHKSTWIEPIIQQLIQITLLPSSNTSNNTTTEITDLILDDDQLDEESLGWKDTSSIWERTPIGTLPDGTIHDLSFEDSIAECLDNRSAPVFLIPLEDTPDMTIETDSLPVEQNFDTTPTPKAKPKAKRKTKPKSEPKSNTQEKQKKKKKREKKKEKMQKLLEEEKRIAEMKKSAPEEIKIAPKKKPPPVRLLLPIHKMK